MKYMELTGIKQIELKEGPIPQVGPHEVRIRVSRVGVCGSDMHAYDGTHPFVHPPMILGHEVAGLVDAVGEGVSRLQKDDLVTIEPNMVCGTCVNCQNGRYNICERLQVIGCVGYNGGQAEYLVVPDYKVIKVPQDWTSDQAVLVEPFAVGVHAVRQARLSPGDNVFVIGAGMIGLVTLQAALIGGAGTVVVSDPLEDRLQLGKKFGAHFVAHPDGDKISETIKEYFGFTGADVVFDCVGNEKTIDTAIACGRKGVKIILVGVPRGKFMVNMACVQDQEVEIIGTIMYTAKDYHTTIQYLTDGRMKTDGLVTHHFPLEEAGKAIETALNPLPGTLKILLDV